MADKVMVVTGGSRGIGAAVCRMGAARGYGVVVNYAGNREAAARVCAEISAAGGEAVAVQGDVGSENDVETIFAAADRMGPVTALVNNAGIINSKSRVADMDAAAVARLMQVNVVGSILCAQAAIRRMSQRSGGSGGGIVNITSGAAKLGAPGTYVDYAASKGAVDTMTVGMAQELAEEGIRVNAVRPGLIDTEFHAMGGEPDRAQRVARDVPMKRAGTADEVASAVLWLLSDEAAYVTGTILAVTGGRALTP